MGDGSNDRWECIESDDAEGAQLVYYGRGVAEAVDVVGLSSYGWTMMEGGLLCVVMP